MLTVSVREVSAGETYLPGFATSTEGDPQKDLVPGGNLTHLN